MEQNNEQISSGLVPFFAGDWDKNTRYTVTDGTFGVKGIVLGKGNPSWGAPNEIVFIIKLGRRVA